MLKVRQIVGAELGQRASRTPLNGRAGGHAATVVACGLCVCVTAAPAAVFADPHAASSPPAPAAAEPQAVAAPTPARTSPPSPLTGTGPLARAGRRAVFTRSGARLAIGFLGRPYQWSGIGRRGFDCSGLVFRVFSALGRVLPHSSAGQYRAGIPIAPSALEPGDLVFFHTYDAGPSHVGIYLGAGQFVHASYSRGVVVSSMEEPYYRSRYLGARRL